jgi:hypothetical protein
MIVLLAILLLLLLVFYGSYKESFDNNIVIVVSRYNEKMDWLKEEPFNRYPVIIYNKGINDDFYKPDKLIKVVKVDNVGRCDHTFLYHIVQNYDNLNNITIFLNGSNNMENKLERSKTLIKKIEQHNKAVFLSSKIDENDIYDFKIDKYQATSSENNVLNSEDSLELSKIRPFGKWKDAMFGDVAIDHIAYSGIFSISNKDVLQHPKSYYENLTQQLSNTSNPEVGHYFERAWQVVFSPMNDTIVIDI